MTNHTARMAALLGELRREMNGAVAESMQRGEGGYGLNYGVSIPTIRAIAGRVGTDHAFARFLYRQDVRELRMAALTIADPVSVTPDNVDEWFVGRMPEELIEELALRLLSRCGRPVLDTLCGRWLRAGSGAERYAALMALARARVQEFDAAAIVEAVPDAVAACPDGVQKMSMAMPGLVQTSTNLARVVSDGRTVKLQCLLRSSVNTEKEALGESIAAVFALAGAKTELTGAYNGWNPDMESPILKAMTASYEALYGRKPAVTAIHAGLECGIIGSTYPKLDMISFGPTICYPHSPDEKVEIASVGKFYDFLVDTLRNVPEK